MTLNLPGANEDKKEEKLALARQKVGLFFI